MKYKKIVLGAIIMTLLFSFFGCSDILKINEMNPIEKQSDYFNKHIENFNAVVSIFNLNNNIRFITSSSSWLDPQDNEVVKELEDIFIQSTTQLSDEEYSSYTSIAKKLISNKGVVLAANTADYIKFIYASTLGEGVGWMYCKNGYEPRKEEDYIIQMEKIDDEWYAIRFY